MPGPLLLTIDSQTAVQLERAARHGDQGAAEQWRELWSPFQDRFPIECFICPNPVEYPPPHTAIVSDIADKTGTTMIGAPLCSTCGSLPSMMRWGRVMRTYRASTRSRSHYVRPPKRQLAAEQSGARSARSGLSRPLTA
jgi:hypothetical protein